ncbi:hypothetical protein [Nonomuraea endophytica]|uniref:Uncharacterized protein n=1 Tax=Nonomuraea endophytica TaxID=714136 RepID=A0A7W8A817_9ACTN|nr:hypothetical protein [Nonomuraea endophytica]MBB5081317.1 hypothetical protein [Nonomuraea endophytica]
MSAPLDAETHAIRRIVGQYGKPTAILALYAHQHETCAAYGPLRAALVESLPEELDPREASDLADELIDQVRRHILIAEYAPEPTA